MSEINWASLAQKHYGSDDRKEVLRRQHADSKVYDGRKHPFDDSLFTKMTFPYYNPDPSLPPIPTPEDVEKARSLEFIDTGRMIKRSFVYRVNGAYAVKFDDSQSILQEAENLLFLQDHEIRTPKVYAAFTHKGADPLGITVDNGYFAKRPHSELPAYNYLVMEWIDGVCIQDRKDFFKQFDEEARKKIYSKVGKQVQLLRSIPSPTPSYYGRIHNQPFHPHFLPLRYGWKDFIGPFDTHQDFAQALRRTAENNIAGNLNSVSRKMIKVFGTFDEGFDMKPKACEPKLTHYDLNVQNIRLIRPDPSLDSSIPMEDWEVCLIDWEFLAWMPAYMEFGGAEKRLPYEPEMDFEAWWGVFKDMKYIPIKEILFFTDFCWTCSKAAM